MFSYRDMTFCEVYDDCKKGKTCHRALTPKVEKAADEWWGKEGAPISVFGPNPNCMEKK